MKEPEPMREIHAIQEKIYGEENGLSDAEKVEKIHREAQELIQKYGLKFKKKADKAA